MTMTLKHKYEIDLYWSDEDQVFLAEVPDLPGCMAHGDTHEEALAEIQVAIGLCLDVMREEGWPIPEPRRREMRLE